VFFRVELNFAALYVTPAIGAYLVAMHVREYMGLVAAPINIELIEVSHKCVICARLRCILRIEINPFLLNRLELS